MGTGIMIKAILMDLDGVLVDACEWHYLSLNKALSEVGATAITRAEHETIFNGLPTNTKLEILAQQGRVRRDQFQQIWSLKQEFTKDSIIENSGPDDEKIRLHEWTHSQGIVSACVTNSICETATLMLDMTGQLRFMKFIITNEQVKNPKPHGEGYIRAMVRLGMEPDSCLIVEDSDKGLRAAHSTGAMVLPVRNATETAMLTMKKIKETNGY